MKLPAVMSAPCPLCHRRGEQPSDHHLIPACRGGTGQDKVIICTSCHEAVHQIFGNKELETTYNSVDALLGHEAFAKTARFIGRQKGRVRTKLANNQKRRGRNG
jgi:5-methylcytosine-specific restriction protein A